MIKFKRALWIHFHAEICTCMFATQHSFGATWQIKIRAACSFLPAHILNMLDVSFGAADSEETHNETQAWLVNS